MLVNTLNKKYESAILVVSVSSSSKCNFSGINLQVLNFVVPLQHK